MNSRLRAGRSAAVDVASRQATNVADAGKWMGSALVGFVALVVYLLLAPPVAGDRDSGELTLVLATNGVAHPTGYPLYTLFGSLFVHVLHAMGASWAFSANAWSALGGGVALALLHALALRLVPAGGGLGRWGRGLAALLPVCLFGFDPIWTRETTLAEVYSWHLAWVCGAALCYVALAAEFAAQPPPAAARRRRMAVVWGLTCGIGAAHHLTALLVAAPLSIGLAWLARRCRSLHWGDAARALVAAGLPLLAYGVLAYRTFHPAPTQWPMLGPSWSSLLAHVTGAAYHAHLGRFAPSDEQRRHLLEFIYPMLAVGGVSLLAAAARARDVVGRPVLVWLAVAALLCTVTAFNYGVADPAAYFLAPMALGMAGLARFGADVAARIGRHARRLAAIAVTLVTLGCAVGWVGVARERRQAFIDFETRLHHMWQSIPFEQAVILWPDDMYARLLAYQRLGGEKLGLEVENPIILSNAVPRTRFVARHGFDPLQGVTFGLDAATEVGRGSRALGDAVEEIARNINQRESLPVLLFDPEKQSVRLLRKPAAADAPGGVSGAPPGP